MEILKDTKIFSGAMDSDNNARVMLPNDYRIALNKRNGITRYSNKGTTENILGNIEIDNAYLPSGRNVCITSPAYEDLRDNSLIFANWNENGYHGWYRFYANKTPYPNGVIEPVYIVANPSLYDKFNPNPLNFQEDHKITGVSLIDEVLYWTDGYNQPKQIDTSLTNGDKKKRVFNIYFDAASLLEDTSYDFTTASNTNSFGNLTFSVTGTAKNYTDRAKELFVQISQLSVLQGQYNVVNKGQFLQLECLIAGDSFVQGTQYPTITPLLTRDVVIVPDNFYPDWRFPGSSYSWRGLEQWHTNVIKSPPQCAPSVRYVKKYDFSSALMNIELTPETITGLSSLEAVSLGADNDSTGLFYDNINQFFLGSGLHTTLTIGLFSAWNPNSYWFANFPPYTVINVRLTLNFTVTMDNPDDTFIVLWGIVQGGFGLTSFPLGGIQSEHVNTNHITKSVVFEFQYTAGASTIKIAPVIRAEIDGAPVGHTYHMQITSGVFELNVANQKRNVNLEQPYIFRARYIYYNYQKSVYGAVSVTPKPITYKENAIELDFTDARLNDSSYLSQIKKVVLACSPDDGTTWFDFKTLEPYEFAGTENQVYYFYGSETLIPSQPAENILPYHSVPNIAQSQEYIDERVWYGGIKEGYDQPLIDIKLTGTYGLVTGSAIYPDNNIYTEAQKSYNYGSFWKRGWEGCIGIVYMDDYDRKVLCVNDQCRFKCFFWNETDPSTGIIPAAGACIVNWSISSPPPEWATKYQWARTKNLQHGDYLLFRANTHQVVYLNSSYDDIATDPTLTTLNATYIRIKLDAITDYNATGAKMPITVANIIGGYIIRFAQASSYKEYVITKVDIALSCVYIKNDGLLSLPNFDVATLSYNDAVYEIFAPKTISDNLFYYEFGECFEIGTKEINGITVKYHKGQTQDQSFGTTPLNIVTPATGTFGYGYGNARYRAFQNKSGVVPTLAVNRSNILDTVLLNSDNDGRTSVPSLIGERDRPTAIRFSDQFLSNTETNGLNAFQALNQVQYSTNYGLLQKMIVEHNDILKLIFNNSVQLDIYVSQGVIHQSQVGGTLISVATEVAGNSHIIQLTLGTQNPESVNMNDEGDVFGWDEAKGTYWRASGNGLIQISDYKQSNNFSEIASQRNALERSKSFAPAIYDIYYDEILQSFNSLVPRETKLPKAEITLFDIDASTNIINIIGTCNGQQLFLINPSTLGYPDISQMLVDTINVNGLGMSATEELGVVEVTAPVPYSLKNISIAITFLDISLTQTTKYYNFCFEEGWYGDEAESPGFTGRTIAFNKQKNGWITYYSFVPEAYGRLRNQIISFVNGKLYLHDKGTDYNNFYGTQYNSSIKTIFVGADPKKVKVIKGVWIKGKGKQKCIITIKPFDGAVNGMRSDISTAAFLLTEGGYYAEVARDRNTPGYTDPVLAQINGREVRGEEGEVELINEGSEFNVLYLAEILYFNSELS